MTTVSQLIQELGEEKVAKLRLLLGAVDFVEEAKVGDVDQDVVESKKVRQESSSSSVSSWSEMMENDQVLSGVPVVPDGVRERVTFGGFGGKVAPPSAAVSSEGGMAQYVRTQQAKQLRMLLSSLGIKMPKASTFHMALVTHTAATMPGFFRGGKDVLRTFAVLGDAALVASVAAVSLQSGQKLESVQSLRTTVLTDAFMQTKFAASNFVSCVSFAAGVLPAHTKTGATALEAIVGLVAYYRSPSDVTILARHFQLF